MVIKKRNDKFTPCYQKNKIIVDSFNSKLFCQHGIYEKTKIETINEVVKIELTYKIRLTENQINEIYNRIGFDLLIKKNNSI